MQSMQALLSPKALKACWRPELCWTMQQKHLRMHCHKLYMSACSKRWQGRHSRQLLLPRHLLLSLLRL